MDFLPSNPLLWIFFIPFIVASCGVAFIILYTVFTVIIRVLEVFALAFVGEDPTDSVKFAILPVTIKGERVWMKKYYYVSVWAYGGGLHSGGYSKIVDRSLTPYSEAEQEKLYQKHRYRGKAC